MPTRRIAAVLVLLGLGLGCGGDPEPGPAPTPPSADYSDAAEQAHIERLARELVGDALGKVERSGGERNYVAVRSEHVLVSQRLDSRTTLVQDDRFGVGRPSGVFAGDDEALVKIGRGVLRKLSIPEAEIVPGQVLREQSQLGQLDPDGRIAKLEDPRTGRLYVRFARAVDEIPVFSSNALIALDQKGGIGFLRVHWPEIPPAVLREAHRLQYKVENGWRAPERTGARVESVEAGIVHSAALGFVMDVYPAIRVIYSPEDPRIGRKLMLYLDRDGEPVPNPRQFEQECPECPKPRRSKQTPG